MTEQRQARKAQSPTCIFIAFCVSLKISRKAVEIQEDKNRFEQFLPKTPILNS
jgi:hypothetical protein